MSCLQCGHVGRLHGGPTGTCQSPGCQCGAPKKTETVSVTQVKSDTHPQPPAHTPAKKSNFRF